MRLLIYSIRIIIIAIIETMLLSYLSNTPIIWIHILMEVLGISIVIILSSLLLILLFFDIGEDKDD